MYKKFVIYSGCIFFMIHYSEELKAQKLCVNKLVNTIYSRLFEPKEVDTVLFLNDCNSNFFSECKLTTTPIKVIFFSYRDTLNNYLKSHNHYYLFKLNIESIGAKVLRLKIGLYRGDNSLQDVGGNLLTFIDERKILCTLSKNGWQFLRNEVVYDH